MAIHWGRDMAVSQQNSFVKKSIEKALTDLPALPAVVARVLQETERPDGSAATVERLISADQALTSKVLRVVNSAYYGLAGQVTSLSQAIVILGMQQVRNLVLSVSAIGSMKPKTSRQHEVLRQFWLHSFGAAAAANLISKKKGIAPKDQETLFVAGLLHDIGRLFLFCNFTQTYDQVLKYATEKQITIEEAEAKLLGIGHAEIGADMARFWQLPTAITDLIGGHEGPFDESTNSMFLALHYADVITKDLYFDETSAITQEPDPRSVAWLGLNDIEHASLLSEIRQKVDDAAQLFGMIAAA